ncbi:hypothetical protein GCM10009424_20100 [Sphingomonas ursincola]
MTVSEASGAGVVAAAAFCAQAMPLPAVASASVVARYRAFMGLVLLMGCDDDGAMLDPLTLAQVDPAVLSGYASCPP